VDIVLNLLLRVQVLEVLGSSLRLLAGARLTEAPRVLLVALKLAILGGGTSYLILHIQNLSF
jgi:hypothetical protein